MFGALIKKLGFKWRALSDEEKEDIATAAWIDKGMESEEVAEETVFTTLKKNGVKV
jgi:hypothetical protein